MPDRMQEDVPDKMSEDMPDRMPDRMPEDMSDRMPEDMPDRMSEDLPVTKRINVMVGITRSKVILFSLFWPEPNHPFFSLYYRGAEVNKSVEGSN
jgi:hypothetical protein